MIIIKMLTTFKAMEKKYGFLNAKDMRLSKITDQLNCIQKLHLNNKPYKLNYCDINEKYLLLGVGDIDKFSNSYTFGWAMINGFINDVIIKHTIYEDIRSYLLFNMHKLE